MTTTSNQQAPSGPHPHPHPGTRHRVVIVGGGFGGLAAARSLRKANADITLIDQRNHHLFQPLLYQVATAALSPADIAAPIRGVLRKQKNCTVVLGRVTSVDLHARTVSVGNDTFDYDSLVIAAGATHSYFGHDEWQHVAPGLKTIEDATAIRRRILLSFEIAESLPPGPERDATLTFAIVGGGPTGVELAGAIREIAVQAIPRDFRRIDTRSARVILLEGTDRLLPAFDPKSSERAKRDLETMGIEVRLGAMVTNVSEYGLSIGDEHLAARNVFWAAGVRASSLGESLDAERDRAGRVQVEPDLSIKGHPEVFVIGDMAAARSADTGEPVPGVAQGALQGGEHAGTLIRRRIADANPTISEPFSYHDKGMMATIGRHRAIAELGGRRFAGTFAWLLWGFIHILFLIGFRNRLSVMLNWVWNWFVFARGARLITGEYDNPAHKHKSELD